MGTAGRHGGAERRAEAARLLSLPVSSLSADAKLGSDGMAQHNGRHASSHRQPCCGVLGCCRDMLGACSSSGAWCRGTGGATCVRQADCREARRAAGAAGRGPPVLVRGDSAGDHASYTSTKRAKSTRCAAWAACAGRPARLPQPGADAAGRRAHCGQLAAG